MWAKFFKPFIETYILPTLLRTFLRFLYYTNRHEWQISDKLKDEPVIGLFWHGELVMQAFTQRKLTHKGPRNMLNSHHKDGALMVNTMKKFGLGTIRGSSRQGAVKALVEAIKFVKAGGSMFITPDGPKGPRHSVSNGAVVLAQKADIPIVAMHAIPTKYWRLNTWDQLIIPKPFGTITFIIGDPFKVTDLSVEEAKEKVQQELLKNAM